MKPTEYIKRLIKNTKIKTNPAVNEAVLNDLLNKLDSSENISLAAKQPNVWRIIMKSKITKFAAAAVAILIAVLSIWSLDKSTSTAYALEQTTKAYEGLHFVHIKDFKEGESEPKEFWVEYDDKEVKKFRLYSPAWAEREGPMVAVWNDGKFRIWGKKDNVVVTRHREGLGLEILELVKKLDPRSMVKELHQLETEGKAEIKTSEPKLKSEPIIITAKILSPSSDAGNQLVLSIDQNTKLVTRAVLNKPKESDGYQHSWEFSDYNIAVDENFFTLSEVTKNIERGDIEQPVITMDSTDTTSTFLKNINSKLALLDINKATADDVIGVFGKPLSYRLKEDFFEEDNLPETYFMNYPGYFIVSIHKNQVRSWGSEEVPGYAFSDSIQIGSTLDEVLRELGTPEKVVEGFKLNGTKFEDNVLYKNMNEKNGYCYYATTSKRKRIRMFFRDNKVFSLHEYRTEPLEQADPTDTTATFMKSINAKLASLDINKSTADDVIRVLGEPWAYRFEGEDLEKDNLPEVYTMDYPGNFIVSIYKNQVMLWGTQQIPGYEISGYVFSDSIQIGTTLDDVFKKLGPPAKVVEGFGDGDNKIMFEDNVIYANMNINERKGFCFHRYDSNGKEIKLYFDDNVLYKDFRKTKGLCLYGTVSKGKRIRLSFMDNKVISVHEYRTDPIKY